MTERASIGDAVRTDAVVIGAGPVGLFQVFELGLQEIKTEVVDSLPRVGGQCVELYADKPIYDIPAVTACSGQELTDRLLAQIAPFKPRLHLHQEVAEIAPGTDDRWRVETSAGMVFEAKVVIVAAGIGAFRSRRLKLAGIDRHEGTQVWHSLDEALRAGAVLPSPIVIVGGNDSALQWAGQLAGATRAAGSAGAAAASIAGAGTPITLIHRRELTALPAPLQGFQAQGSLRVLVAQPTAIEEHDGRLRGLQILDSNGQTQSVAVGTLLVSLGVAPQLGPIARWGLALDRKQVKVDPATFQTSAPGIFAIGDVVTYPGKRKLIVCGFHEATLAAYAVAARVFPGKPLPLLYTTTSPRLHALLGR